jgi:hypothetical protein
LLRQIIVAAHPALVFHSVARHSSAQEFIMYRIGIVFCGDLSYISEMTVNQTTKGKTP